jgi:thiol-disulfide isomerase/thioredoxin
LDLLETRWNLYMTESTNGAARGPRRGRFLAVAALLLVVAAIGVLYGIKRQGGKEAAAECLATTKVAQRVDPFAHGEVAAFSIAKAPQPLPILAFDGPDGAKHTLADFKGRTVLFNLWATWCVPCRQEMPALDRLQAKLGGPAFQVVAVNIDTAKLDKPKQFLADAGVKNLGLYADPSADIFQTLRLAGKVVGLPTSVLLDPQGCEIGTLAGGAEWGSEDALALVKAAIGS